jgi:hypothetical protein
MGMEIKTTARPARVAVLAAAVGRSYSLASTLPSMPIIPFPHSSVTGDPFLLWSHSSFSYTSPLLASSVFPCCHSLVTHSVHSVVIASATRVHVLFTVLALYCTLLRSLGTDRTGSCVAFAG